MSALGRYGSSSERELDAAIARADALVMGRPAPAPAPAELVDAPPEATEVHRQVLALLNDLLGMVDASAGPLAGVFRIVRKMEPVLLRDFARVPPEVLVDFMRELGGRMVAVGAPPAELVDPELELVDDEHRDQRPA